MRTADDLRGLADLCCYVREKIGKYIVVVELGSFVGESTFELAMHFQRVYAVDTWDYPNSENFVEPRKGQTEDYFDKFVKYIGNVTKVKGLTEAVGAHWTHPEIDLLYVDAEHTYKAVKSDLEIWRHHVKTGGFIAGHDYGDSRFPGVRMAVDEVLGAPDEIFADKSWIKRKVAG